MLEGGKCGGKAQEGETGVEGTISNRVVRMGLVGEVTFVQRLEESRGDSRGRSRGKRQEHIESPLVGAQNVLFPTGYPPLLLPASFL